MKKAMIVNFALSVLIALNLSCTGMPKNKLYYQALDNVGSGNIHLAFLKFKDYLQREPNSQYAQDVKFAVAEYYIQIKSYFDAMNALTEYIKEYPADEKTVFAKALLYKILNEFEGNAPAIEKIKKQFFSKSLFLIFADSKSKHYISLFNNNYRIEDYIDKIEVYKNEKIFFKISP